MLLMYFTFAYNGNGQIKHSLTIGPNLGVGANFGKAAKLSLGGSLEYVIKFSDRLGARLYGGYNRFNDKNYPDAYVSFLPVRAGIQGFVYEDVLFVFADGGIANYKSSTDTKKTGPSFGIGAGHRLPIGKSQFVQTSAWFNYYRLEVPPFTNLKYTWFNFRVAYGFSFGKKNEPEE